MYPNLLGQQKANRLTNDDMAQIIGVSRNAYDQKLKSCRFTVEEVRAYCEHFNKSFRYLFAKDSEMEPYFDDHDPQAA